MLITGSVCVMGKAQRGCEVWRHSGPAWKTRVGREGALPASEPLDTALCRAGICEFASLKKQTPQCEPLKGNPHPAEP